MTPEEQYQSLLEHLKSLYALAQVVTPDADRASRLVEAAYREAAARLYEAPGLQSSKAWLFHLMLQIHQAEAAPVPESTVLDYRKTPPPPALDQLRRSLTNRLVDRLLPSIFFTLPQEDQLLLTLCEVEGLSCAAGGMVLGLQADAACERLAALQRAILDRVHEYANASEQHLVEQSLAPRWLQEGLARLLNVALVPVPPTLGPTLEAPLPESSFARPAPSSAPAYTPALDRQDAAAPAPRVSRRITHLATALVLITLAALIGYYTTSFFPEEEPEVDLVLLSTQQAGAIRPMLDPGSPEQAERFVQDRLGWRVTVPDIDGARLTGLGISEIAEGVEVPVFLYEDAEQQQTITLYTYSYALLDRFSDRIRLTRDVLNQIENDEHFDLHDLGETQVLIWRNEDDIFLAVTPGNAEALRGRISFPS
jgi:DNA-directed RNA polymerase specialized sigma24 family protein